MLLRNIFRKMNFQNLLAYRKSFTLAMRIFEISKSFPKEEKYSLTDQIRRSSRRTDSEAENLETQTWLHFMLECQYVGKDIYSELIEESQQVGKLIYFMINNPGKFGSK